MSHQPPRPPHGSRPPPPPPYHYSPPQLSGRPFNDAGTMASGSNNYYGGLQHSVNDSRMHDHMPWDSGASSPLRHSYITNERHGEYSNREYQGIGQHRLPPDSFGINAGSHGQAATPRSSLQVAYPPPQPHPRAEMRFGGESHLYQNFQHKDIFPNASQAGGMSRYSDRSSTSHVYEDPAWPRPLPAPHRPDLNYAESCTLPATNAVVYSHARGDSHLYHQYANTRSFPAGYTPPPPDVPMVPWGRDHPPFDQSRHSSLSTYGPTESFSKVDKHSAVFNGQHKMNSGSQKPPLPPQPIVVAEEFYCDACEKSFEQKSAFESHTSTHERCSHPGCSFEASKKVVAAHFHGTHGLYSGTGYKMIDIEGQKFKVLMGTNGKEVEEWRAERRKRFPSASKAKLRGEMDDLVASSGGVPQTASKQKGNPARGDTVPPTKSSVLDEERKSVQQEGDELEGNKRRVCFLFLRSRCRKGASCEYVHDKDAPRPICKNYVIGRCKYGNKCMYQHEADKALVGPSSACTSERTKELACGRKRDSSVLAGEKKTRNKSLLHLPIPLGANGSSSTLLRRLLQRQGLEEENALLQALHFIAGELMLHAPTAERIE